MTKVVNCLGYANQWCENWELGTYSSTSNITIGSDTTQNLCVQEFLQASIAASSPTVTPDDEIPLRNLNGLETVVEERSSEISSISSQQVIESAAGSIAAICSSTLSLNKGKNQKSDKKKSGSSESLPLVSTKNSEPSKHHSPSPSKSKNQKKKTDHVEVGIEEEHDSFSPVKEKKNRKSNSQEKLTAATSASPEKASLKSSQPKKSQPRIPSPDIQPYKPKYTEKPSRQVDRSISYAQVASCSALTKDEIPIDSAAAALLQLKEPEPPRSTTTTTTNKQNKQFLGSSESNSESPAIFQTIPIVHRADITESKNTEDSPKRDKFEAHPEQLESNSSQEKKEEGIKKNPEKAGSSNSAKERKLIKEESEEKTRSDDLSPIDSSERDYSIEETAADDEFSESVEEFETKPAAVLAYTTQLTGIETYSGENQNKEGESNANIEKPSTSQTNQSSIQSVDKSISYESKPDYYFENFVHPEATPLGPNCTIADVNSDILDTESREDEDRPNSFEKEFSKDETHDEKSSENLIGRGKKPILHATSVHTEPNKLTETETLYSGEELNEPGVSGTNIEIANQQSDILSPETGDYPSSIDSVDRNEPLYDEESSENIIGKETIPYGTVRPEPEQLTEIETLYSGEELNEPGVSRTNIEKASTSKIKQSIASSQDSSTHVTYPFNKLVLEGFMECEQYIPNPINILNYQDKEDRVQNKLKYQVVLSPQTEGYLSDIDSLTDSRSEEISRRPEHRRVSVDPSDSSRSEQGVKILIQPCSSDSRDISSSAGEEYNLGLLGVQGRDPSEDSLETAARLRKISYTEEQKLESKDDSKKKLRRKSKRSPRKGKQGKSDKKDLPENPKKNPNLKKNLTETGGDGPSSDLKETEPSEENQNLPIENLVSEEIQEEKKFIQEEPEVDNQAVYKPDFLQFETEGVPENIHSEENSMKKADFDITSEEMPVRVETDSSDPPKKKLENMKQRAQVRVLTLNDNEELQEYFLYRLEKNWLIEFRLGPTLFGRKINIFCNFPAEENGRLKEFNRTQYQCLKWNQDGGSGSSDDTALYTQIECSISGSFRYYFKDNSTNKICGSGYFLVDPEITYGEKEHLRLDCIQCQTVISKHLGSFSTWESKLRVSKESGYNMIHFTPVQELGASNSAYCLNDQLKLNQSFKKENGDVPTWEELKCLINKMRTEWKVTSICDIVLNHTANESSWIKEHTEATYNCQNCKYMRPAYLLDAALSIFNKDVKEGMYETRGIPPVIDSEDHLNAMQYHLKETVIKELKLYELFICNVNDYISKFMDMARQHQPEKDADENVELILVQDPEYRRLASSIDLDLAMKIYNVYRPDCFDEDSRLRRSCEEFKRKLDSLNQVVIDKIQDHLKTAVDNIISGVRYWRVNPDGPKLAEISIKDPLITRYFTDFGNPKNIREYEEIMYSDEGRFLMAHNGWIMSDDPLINFANPDSNVYIRRELIAWGDSVKLRYGDEPSDSPFLWDMMKKYVELTASIFDGVRLDNCHSTPIKVAQYLMDCARKIRPDLYVVAELFTNSDRKDNYFVNKLGITSLIREAMSAPNSHDHGRLVYQYGGIPVGSFYQPDVRPLVPTIAHALFFDLTHDNPSPVEKKSVFDLLPSSAIVNMACCGTGSNRGYDELVPHQISVVDETRDYSEWITENVNKIPKYTSIGCGIIKAKKALNDLHFKLGCDGFNQVYVDQIDGDVVAVTRHCPKTHQSYILVAFTAFSHPNSEDQRGIRPLRVEGVLDEIVLEATLSHVELSNGGSKYAHLKNFEKNDHYINGYSEYMLHMKQNIQLNESDMLEEKTSGNPNEIALHFKNFKPGSIVIIKVSLKKSTSEAVTELRKLADQFSYTQETDLKRIIRKLKLCDLNRVLYRCDQEERDEGKGFDTYGIPGFEKLVYAGLQGFISLLSKIRPLNDLGHPMCGNIRQGDWMIEYIYQRLKLDEGTEELGTWIEDNTKALKNIPKYLKPAYFDLIFTGIYVLLLEHSYNSMSSFVKNGSMFVKALSMGSIQFAAYVRSADLPPLSPNLAPPKPPTKKDENGKETQICVSLSAGLPHFSVGYMRNWGRDTFIALRGLLLLTGRYQEARYHILAYGACLRHGLIPNLLDGGRKSRYNCRDAVWWWLYCIRCYAEEVPDGVKILEDKVSRIFPTDDSPAQQPGATDQSLQDVMQEALNRHFQGVSFRERSAGREIDEHMTDNGFNNQIGVHPETGFVFGGNVDNCGTWMDKMGSSQKAGNKGRPATPRDGSACEIVGLSKCVISWLAGMHDKSLYKYGGVERTHSNGKTTNWSFTFWADKIQENFEKYFWVNEKPTEGEMKPDLINKRGIYKDCYGATQEWTDYQLRCNFPIVMVVAPELFNPQHAWTALQKVEKLLLGPLGMKTLDPEDWAYRADYDNSNDSEDATVAHGFNYHQGPEWLWPVGFFFRAKLYFAAKNGKLEEAIAKTKEKLSLHFTELQTSDWKGLPELTNSNGSYCNDSSRTQAWSMSCILEVLHDLQRIESSISLEVTYFENFN